MKTNPNKKNNPAFLAWQNRQKPLVQIMAAEWMLMTQTFKDILEDCTAVNAESERLINELIREHGDERRCPYSWDTHPEFMEVRAVVVDEIERIKLCFHNRWCKRYKEYVAEMKVFAKKQRKIRAGALRFAVYKKAMKNLDDDYN